MSVGDEIFYQILVKLLVADDKNRLCKKSLVVPKLISPDEGSVRFSTVAAVILGPATMATSTRANHALVMTDLFTMYTIAVSLASTDSLDVARELAKKRVLRFGAPNSLHTDQRKNFVGKLVQEMCQFWGIEKTQTSPYVPKDNEKTEGHSPNKADGFLELRADNQKMRDTKLLYLNFVYNTTMNQKTGASPFIHSEAMMRDNFVEWLDKQFPDAHSKRNTQNRPTPAEELLLEENSQEALPVS